MIFTKYYSSSRGNLYEVVAENGQRLLVECGVPWKRLEKALTFDLKNIVGCLTTHEHFDHSKAIEDVLKAGIPVYASEGTLKEIEDTLPLARNSHVIRAKERFKIGETFEVFPFATIHDAVEPLGFVIHEVGGEDMIFVTDTRDIPARFALPFSIVAIEASYDKEILRDRVKKGGINEEVAKRLLESHQEWRVAKRYLLEYVNLEKCREVHLLHPSGENLNKKEVRQDIEKSVIVRTLI